MKKTLVLFGLTILLLLLGGCGLLSERSYLYTQQHDEQYEEDVNADALTVDNYYGLKNAILSFVESGTEDGLIRSYSYDGDIESDLEMAAYEVTRSNPVGAYAVDYMTHDCNKIVSYYEIRISITFRRTPEDIAAIVRVSSMDEAEEAIAEALSQYQSVLALRMSYTNDLNTQQILEDACRADPLISMASPEVSTQVYPETGVQRIVELNFSYAESETVLTLKKEQVLRVVEDLGQFVSEDISEESRLGIYFRRLCNRIAYAPESGAGDVYEALVNCQSGSKGIAEAFYLLCVENGIECVTVSGQKYGETYWWNIVTLDGQSYHVDLASAMEANTVLMELYYDEDLYAAYSWDTALYPACTRPEGEESEKSSAEEASPEETSEEETVPAPESGDLLDDAAEEPPAGSSTEQSPGNADAQMQDASEGSQDLQGEADIDGQEMDLPSNQTEDSSTAAGDGTELEEEIS